MIFPTDEDWQKWQIAEDAHKFFLLRWEEVFNEETFDSWKLRSSNVRTILREILAAADIVERVHVYHHNLISLIDELECVVKQDLITKRYYSFVANTISEIRVVYEKSIRHQEKADTGALRRMVSVLIGSLADYCERLFSEAYKILSSPPVKYKIDLDGLIMLLGIELKSLGYSITSLRNSISVLQDATIPSFPERFLRMKSLFSTQLKQYECYFILSWSGHFPEISSYGVLPQTPPEGELSEVQEAFYDQDKSPLVVMVPVKAMDVYSARSIAESILESIFSAKKMYQASKTVAIKHSQALVRSSEQEELVGPDTSRLIQLKDSKQSDSDLADLFKLHDTLKSHDFAYLSAALQYHKLAIISGTDEVRLVNLWIALESLVQEGDGNIIERVTKMLPCVLATIYIYSLLRAISEDMRFLWRCVNKEKLLPMLHESNKYMISPKDLLRIFLDVDQGELISQFTILISENPLMLFRVNRLREQIFKDPKVMLDRLRAHKEGISWQLKRIYRLRNNIIHQGKSYPEARQLLNHLHGYFLRTMHSIIHDLKANHSWGISDVFEYRMMLFGYLELRLKNYRDNPFPREFIMDFRTDSNCELKDGPWITLPK